MVMPGEKSRKGKKGAKVQRERKRREPTGVLRRSALSAVVTKAPKTVTTAEREAI